MQLGKLNSYIPFDLILPKTVRSVERICKSIQLFTLSFINYTFMKFLVCEISLSNLNSILS